ncbi:hypothetical protein [Aquifex aeolicus]|uniref:Uncharacterized protein aq_581 n=1 Tax=Aquifex aeolicus (strain VF5) TaxID=224324 RepID=Y581_AQUAE|nr:hypothetical protein [Aquifex aeolicus]O66848.1 RecName: Full=Uncharacterized protein aq_581 [Aquifex aeolicus VF5]AAC06807.1 putative protein [Aquifex aeolicus VF5]
MSTKEIICTLKGQFFLSPREEKFLRLLEEMGIPEEDIQEGIRECLKSVSPKKRKNFPLFKCFSKILEVNKVRALERGKREHLDWKRVFERKVSVVKHLLDFNYTEPKTEEEAEKTLQEIERKIFKKLWENLDKERKREIYNKYKEVKEDEELFKELIKHELRKIFQIPVLSLYVD